MTDDIVTQPEQEMDFVEYLRLWASVNPDDQTIKDLHRAADEIERLRTELKAFEKGYLVIQEDRQHLRKQVVLWQDIAINLAHHSEGWIDGGKAFEDYLDNLEGKAVRTNEQR